MKQRIVTSCGIRAPRNTVDEVLTFPADGDRYELVDGELLLTPEPGTLRQIVTDMADG